MMKIEDYIQQLIDQGKISQEEIDRQVGELQASQPPTQEEIKMLKKRQDESENAVMMLMELQMMGGM